MPEMNYNPLRGRMRECGLTQNECAAKIGLSERRLNRKLAGEYDVKQDEIHSLCRLLDIDAAEIGQYFSALEVEEYQPLLAKEVNPMTICEAMRAKTKAPLSDKWCMAGRRDRRPTYVGIYLGGQEVKNFVLFLFPAACCAVMEHSSAVVIKRLEM